MRIFRGQVPLIARDIIDTLVKQELIEVDPDRYSDAVEDMSAILSEYLKTDRELTDRARDESGSRGGKAFNRAKRRMARARGFAYGPDAQEWIVEQMLEMLLYTGNIEEVYGDDRALRRQINLVFRNYSGVENELDREARGKLKNLEEGSAAWELEYDRLIGNLKKQRGLS